MYMSMMRDPFILPKISTRYLNAIVGTLSN
jgi:hypothetical protein